MDVWVGAQTAPLVGRRMSSDGELTDQGLEPKRYDEETRALFRELRRRTIVFEGERVLLANGKQGERAPGMQDAASQFVQLTWLFTTHPELLQVGQHLCGGPVAHLEGCSRQCRLAERNSHRESFIILTENGSRVKIPAHPPGCPGATPPRL